MALSNRLRGRKCAFLGASRDRSGPPCEEGLQPLAGSACGLPADALTLSSIPS